MLNKNIVLFLFFTFYSFIFFNVALAKDDTTLSKSYDDYVNNYTKKNITFGHDIDVQGKLVDLVKTYVDKSSIGGEKWEKIKNGLVNEFDLLTKAQKEGLTASDLHIFAAKTLLPYVKGGELLSEEKLELLRGTGVSVAETGSKNLGSYLGDGQVKAVGEDIALTVLDTLCPQCAVSRRAILVGYESARAGEAWVEDQATQDEFKRWDGGSKFREEFMVLPGQSQVYRNAKRVLMESIGCKDEKDCDMSTERVMAFIDKQFEKWQKEKTQAIEEASILAQAKEEFLKQKASQINSFGKTELDRVKNFSSELLDTYNDLLSHRPDNSRPLSEIGRKKLITSAMYLLTKRNRSMVEYRKFFADQLRRLGWKEKAVTLTKQQKEDRALHVKNRLSRLNHEKLQQVFEFMGIKKKVPKSFYNCLCVTAAYGSSGTRQYYLPSNEFIEPFDERYSCQKPGDPCIVSGFGCGRHPFPKDAKIWGDCMESNRLDVKKDENGTIIPKSGVRLDKFIADELQKGR